MSDEKLGWIAAGICLPLFLIALFFAGVDHGVANQVKKDKYAVSESYKVCLDAKYMKIDEVMTKFDGYPPIDCKLIQDTKIEPYR